MDLFETIRSAGRAPVNILHGTDWWTDCDDVAALRLLLRAHKEGLIRLLGIGINSVMEYSAPSVSSFCAYDGVKVPIGVDKSAVRDGGKCRYQKMLAGYPHSIRSNDDCPDAWRLYRETLAGSREKVDIIDVGFPQIIMQLLQSGPDGLSPLSGEELVKEKVGRIWLMAGKWDVPDGLEYNLSAYPVCSEAGDFICRRCPVPITFVGHEVGLDVITGSRCSEDDPLKQAFNAHGSANGRSSWDPLTALAAIAQDPQTAGFTLVKGYARVDPETGRNNFIPDENGPHSYVKRLYTADWYADAIDALL